MRGPREEWVLLAEALRALERAIARSFILHYDGNHRDLVAAQDAVERFCESLDSNEDCERP